MSKKNSNLFSSSSSSSIYSFTPVSFHVLLCSQNRTNGREFTDRKNAPGDFFFNFFFFFPFLFFFFLRLLFYFTFSFLLHIRPIYSSFSFASPSVCGPFSFGYQRFLCFCLMNQSKKHLYFFRIHSPFSRLTKSSCLLFFFIFFSRREKLSW